MICLVRVAKVVHHRYEPRAKQSQLLRPSASRGSLRRETREAPPPARLTGVPRSWPWAPRPRRPPRRPLLRRVARRARFEPRRSQACRRNAAGRPASRRERPLGHRCRCATATSRSWSPFRSRTTVQRPMLRRRSSRARGLVPRPAAYIRSCGKPAAPVCGARPCPQNKSCATTGLHCGNRPEQNRPHQEILGAAAEWNVGPGAGRRPACAARSSTYRSLRRGVGQGLPRG